MALWGGPYQERGEKERGARTHVLFFLHCTVYYVYTPYVCMQNIYIYYTCACVCTLAYVNVYMHTVI